MDFRRLQMSASMEQAAQRAGIAVIGGALFCTSQTCSHMELEFRTPCLQAASLEQLAGFAADCGALRLVIVDEDLADDLLERPEAYQAINPSAMLALGYRNVQAARRHFDRNRAVEGPMIGYLAMNAPLEVLLSSMRMLFHGEYFVPHGVLGQSGAEGAPARPAAPDARAKAPDSPATLAPEEAAPDSGAGADGPETARRFSRLTDREREILALVSDGSSNKQIARQLGITEHTVKLHMHNLFGKFGVSNRTAAANMYFLALAQNAAR